MSEAEGFRIRLTPEGMEIGTNDRFVPVDSAPPADAPELDDAPVDMHPAVRRAALIAQKAPIVIPPVLITSTEPRTLAQLRRELRARLRTVKREIKARKNLEAEAEQITRLLGAIDTKPAPVRAMRSVG